MRRGTAAPCGPHVATLDAVDSGHGVTPGDRIPVDPPPAIVDDGVCSLSSSDGAREIESLRNYFLCYFIKRGVSSLVCNERRAI